MRGAILIAALLPLAAGGCVARAAWSVATLPVKAGAQVVDWSTTSSKERDEHYAHQQRKLAEQRRDADRAAAKRDAKLAKRDRARGIDRDL